MVECLEVNVDVKMLTGSLNGETRQYHLCSSADKYSRLKMNKLSSLLTPTRSMFIQTQETPNPNCLKFIPGVQAGPFQPYTTGGPLLVVAFTTRGTSSADIFGAYEHMLYPLPST
uniref:Uncharacterized protein n=1 Tax=Timema cristinae TaxID=61476 RepID=A0A7R9DF18_TIMCR|nr:unnamed protein product [Timema cristinae]